MTLQRHDILPMFSARNRIDGSIVDYRDVWQRSHLVLVSLSDADTESDEYMRALSDTPALHGREVTIVVTGDAIPGIPRPGAVIADRWGEVRFVACAERSADLPRPQTLAEWVHSIRMECPECQGESR